MFETKKPDLYGPKSFSLKAEHEETKFHDPELEVIERRIALAPGVSSYYVAAAELMIKRNALTLALPYLEKALTHNPRDTYALCYKAFLLQENGDNLQAGELLEQALTLRPKCPDVLSQYGAFLFEQNQPDKAWHIFKDLLAVDPDNRMALLTKGILDHNYKFDDTTALACLDRALTLYPASVSGWVYKWSVYLDNADYKGFEKVEHPVADNSLLGRLYRTYRLIFSALEKADADLSDAEAYELEHQTGGEELLASIFHVNNLESYRQYLARMAKDYQANGVRKQQKNQQQLYLLGDSHTLGHSHIELTLHGQKTLICPRLLMGTKLFHLAEEHAPFAGLFVKALSQLPANAPVAISVGEIDCRPHEGFLPYLTRNKDISPTDFIAKTVRNYGAFLQKYCADRPVIILGVPARLPKGNRPTDDEQRLDEIIRLVNKNLREITKANGYGFLDLYGLTATKGHFADGRHHADAWHLLPSACRTAWQQHLIF